MTQNAQKNYFSEELFAFGGLKVREINPPIRPQLAIYSQASTFIKIEPRHPKTIKKEEKYGQIGEKGKPKQHQALISNKISKGVLRQCQSSFTLCLNELVLSLNALFLQLLQLNMQGTNYIHFSVIYQRTIQPVLQIVDQMPQQYGQLNADYNKLLSATKKIASYMELFKKQANLRKTAGNPPTRSQIFSCLLE